MRLLAPLGVFHEEPGRRFTDMVDERDVRSEHPAERRSACSSEHIGRRSEHAGP